MNERFAWELSSAQALQNESCKAWNLQLTNLEAYIQKQKRQLQDLVYNSHCGTCIIQIPQWVNHILILQ